MLTIESLKLMIDWFDRDDPDLQKKLGYAMGAVTQALNGTMNEAANAVVAAKESSKRKKSRSYNPALYAAVIDKARQNTTLEKKGISPENIHAELLKEDLINNEVTMTQILTELNRTPNTTKLPNGRWVLAKVWKSLTKAGNEDDNDDDTPTAA